MSIESVMLSNHLILCHPLLLLPSIFPSIRVFSSESALHIRWPKYWSFSFSISPSNEYAGLISFRMDWLDLLAVQGTFESLLQHHNSKASILWHSAFFMVQLSHPYMTTGKTIAFTMLTFVPCLLVKSLLPWLSWSQLSWHSFSLSDHPTVCFAEYASCLPHECCWSLMLFSSSLSFYCLFLDNLVYSYNFIYQSTDDSLVFFLIFFHPDLSPELQTHGGSYLVDIAVWMSYSTSESACPKLDPSFVVPDLLFQCFLSQ